MPTADLFERVTDRASVYEVSLRDGLQNEPRLVTLEGKRRLEAALSSPGMPVAIEFTWLPFELNPDMPAEGVERKVYRARKFGAARSAELDVQMASTGREVGIEFAFERMQRTPNTRLAHRLVWEADRQSRQDAVVERLAVAGQHPLHRAAFRLERLVQRRHQLDGVERGDERLDGLERALGSEVFAALGTGRTS